MTNNEVFTDAVDAERTRLTKLRENILGRQATLASELHAVEQELKALDAYEKIKHGKKQKKGSGSRGTRASRRDAILELIQKNPDGMTRGEVIEALGIDGSDTSAKQSISNVLSKLKESEAIRHDEAAKKYYFTNSESIDAAT